MRQASLRRRFRQATAESVGSEQMPSIAPSPEIVLSRMLCYHGQMHDDARRLIAQHAQTARLLGVDFLPLSAMPSVLIQGTPSVAPDQPDQDAPQVSSEPRAESRVHRALSGGALGDQSPMLLSVSPIASAELRTSYEHLNNPQARLDGLGAKYETEAPHQHFNMQFTRIVFGEGDPQADLMFIGEAPGEQEDLTGRPFVGRAGQLLEKMIQAMGFSRETVYITNVLKTRPPGNATPTSQEAALCEPYLMEQIRIIEPKVIVTLGLPATQLLLKVSSPMRSMRGRWHTLPTKVIADGIPQVEIMPTYHPAYLLRSYTQENRRKVWSDLMQVMDKLGVASRK